MAAEQTPGPARRVPDEKQLPILEHLEELRWRIVKCAIAVLVGAIIAYIFRNELLGLLSRPYFIAYPGGKPLQVFSPTEQFSTAMKVAVYGGFVLASPVLFYQVWAFVNPALTPRERRWAIQAFTAASAELSVRVFIGSTGRPR